MCEIAISADDGVTRTFRWNGVDHTLDLCSEHQTELSWIVEHAEIYAKASRTGAKANGKTNGSKVKSAVVQTTKPKAKALASNGSNGASKPVARTDRKQVQAIRDWAKINGYVVKERGRIPAGVTEAFNEANTPRRQKALADA
jgi:hypothetical protein